MLHGPYCDSIRRFGGTISAEHGIGLTKKPWLHYTHSEGGIGLMRRIKRAPNPDGLLNPGNVL
ncbi:FAD-linked oxidase C-terminal domain-containing protein [Paraburkholderia silvatlantica]|uniref:FAD-linked oxidase C-terminal domain-containing protein n=1 Tax=Paraburkholderia silvatlantica TaxID=321895 RepID=UPI003752C422